jgi:hypothetical protein
VPANSLVAGPPISSGAGGGAVVELVAVVVSLLFSGTLARCPDVRWIVNHSGAAAPTLAGRIKDRVPGDTANFQAHAEGKNDRIPHGAYYELKRLYYECAHATYPAMAAIPEMIMNAHEFQRNSFHCFEEHSKENANAANRFIHSQR